MTRFILTAIFGLTVSTQAQALHWLNCSNADGSIMITEHEIWGANPKGCFFQNLSVEKAKVTFVKKSLKVVEKIGGMTADDWERTFTVKAKFSGKGVPKDTETILLCYEVQNSARDFKAQEKPCTIDYE